MLSGTKSNFKQFTFDRTSEKMSGKAKKTKKAKTVPKNDVGESSYGKKTKKKQIVTKNVVGESSAGKKQKKRKIVPKNVVSESSAGKKPKKRKISPKDVLDESSLRFKCNYLSCKKLQPFASLSNLNQHIRIKHKGIRWICPFCQAEQSSKYSHQRHIRRNHTQNLQDDLDQNQFQLLHRVTMTPKAKDSLLGKVMKLTTYQDTLNTEMKKKLKEALIRLSKYEGKSCDDLVHGKITLSLTFMC